MELFIATCLGLIGLYWLMRVIGSKTDVPMERYTPNEKEVLDTPKEVVPAPVVPDTPIDPKLSSVYGTPRNRAEYYTHKQYNRYAPPKPVIKDKSPKEPSSGTDMMTGAIIGSIIESSTRSSSSSSSDSSSGWGSSSSSSSSSDSYSGSGGSSDGGGSSSSFD